MSKLIVAAIIVIAVLGGIYATYSGGYAQGRAECVEQQAAIDKEVYADVINKMQDEGVDLDDASAVDDFLSSLAGQSDGP